MASYLINQEESRIYFNSEVLGCWFN